MDILRGDVDARAMRAGLSTAVALVAMFVCFHAARAADTEDGWRSATAEKFVAETDAWAGRSNSAGDVPNATSGIRRTSHWQDAAANTSERSFRRSTTNQAAAAVRPAGHLQPSEDGLPQLDDPFEDDVVQPETTVLQDSGESNSDEPLYYDPRGSRSVSDDWNGGYGAEPGCGVDSCDCGNCGSGPCGVNPCGFCPPWRCGPPARVWARAEYLMWWTKGMYTPPLVTTAPNGTPRFVPGTDPQVPFAGALGQPGTQILFGGQDLFDELRSGGRITAGIGLDWCYGLGLEFEYFGLGKSHERFLATGLNGDPILARPFFDVNFNNGQGVQSRELVSFPDTIEGSVRVNAENSLNSYGIRLRQNLCCGNLDLGPCCADTCCLQNVSHGHTRWDFIYGYRHVDLEDSIGIREDLVEIDPTIPVADRQRFIVRDGFSSSTRFDGVDLGLAYEFQRCRWSMDLLAKIAFGNNRQRVRINGSTDSTLPDGTTVDGFPRPGGLLTQTTNIGNYDNDHFSVIPEVGVTLGYRLTNNLSLTCGYTFMYWTNVVRAGEQIDFNVDSRLLADPNAAGATRPQFTFHTTDFWAQGLNFGAECRW